MISFPLGRVGELETLDLCVFLRLLESLSGGLVLCLRLDDGERQVAGQVEKIVSLLLWPTARFRSRHDHPSVGDRLLLKDLLVGPPGSADLR